jgi:hypothetical protein
VRSANGDLIAFLDSDDFWLERRLESQVETLERAGAAIPCCVCNVRLEKTNADMSTSFNDAWLWPQRDRGIWLNPFDVLTTRFVFFNQAALLRRSAFERLNGFNEGLRFLEDYDLGLRLALLGPWAFVSDPLVVWQQSPDSLSREALSKAALLKEYEIRIRDSICSDGAQLAPQSKGAKLMQRELRRNRRELPAAVLSQKNSRSARALARAITVLENSKQTVFRRSPWYPKMQTDSLEHWEASPASERRLVGQGAM